MGGLFSSPDIGVKPTPKPKPEEKEEQPKEEKDESRGGGSWIKVPNFAELLQNTINFLFESFFPILDLGYTSAIEILESIIGVKFSDELKDRVNFTMSIIMVVLVFFVVKSSYRVFQAVSGVS